MSEKLLRMSAEVEETEIKSEENESTKTPDNSTDEEDVRRRSRECTPTQEDIRRGKR